MPRNDPFKLPPVTAANTAAITKAVELVNARLVRDADARDIVKALVDDAEARLTFPTYRTALWIGGIYMEAATACHLRTCQILVGSFMEKAELYLSGAGAK